MHPVYVLMRWGFILIDWMGGCFYGGQIKEAARVSDKLVITWLIAIH